VVCLALGFSVWLLMAGPVSVAWLTPYLERELTTATVSVDIEDTQLRLGEDHSLDLRAIGVHVRDPNGRLLGELPEVDIGLSTSALLFERRIAIADRCVAPALTLAVVPTAASAAGCPMSPAPTTSTSALLADF
jgi:hypothetical protein